VRIVEAQIEEFERGAWVADLVTLEESFSGSFDLGGATWTGTAVQERIDGERHFVRVVGGAGKLGEIVRDRYYDGRVSLRAAVQEVCANSGEAFGDASGTVFLASFQRLRGTAAQALDRIADTFGLSWWIGRDGAVRMDAARPPGGQAIGVRTAVDSDGSVMLVHPEGVELGGTYDGVTIRHARWHLTEDRLTAQIYPIPFLFRSPTETEYSSLYSASVDRQNADGSVDVIAAGRFGVTKVPLFSGIPGSKIKLNPGEQVTLGFFGGDPQKPFCVAMAQDDVIEKQVARKADTVQVEIPAGTVIISVSGQAVGTPNPAPIQLTGEITSGSARVQLGD
jgi:hypothetical protein